MRPSSAERAIESPSSSISGGRGPGSGGKREPGPLGMFFREFLKHPVMVGSIIRPPTA